MSKMDERTAKVLKEYLPDDYDPKEAYWIMERGKVKIAIAKHKALEVIAAHNGIEFNEPQFIEMNAKDKIAVVCVTGKLKDKVEWSIGESAPYNTQNTYPYAMAEKRAKDRVILKLMGLHGDMYSQEEADEFKNSEPLAPDYKSLQVEITDALETINNVESLDELMTDYDAEIKAMPDEVSDVINFAYEQKREKLLNGDLTQNKYKFPNVSKAIDWLKEEKPKIEEMTPDECIEWYNENSRYIEALDILNAAKYKKNGKTPKENMDALVESVMKGEAA
jgi:hypothetical protein